MKHCNKCGHDKPDEAFNWKIKNQKRKTVCCSCEREYHQNLYKNNESYRNKRKASTKKYNAKYNERNLKILGNILETTPCTDCGEKDPLVLEFDHVNGKSIGICQLKKNAISVETLLKEVDKCEIVCANCHRKRTYARLNKTWRDKLSSKKD